MPTERSQYIAPNRPSGLDSRERTGGTGILQNPNTPSRRNQVEMKLRDIAINANIPSEASPHIAHYSYYGAPSACHYYVPLGSSPQRIA